MRKVIKGKLYDTESASEVTSYSYGYPGDFQHFTETLYRKRTGEYFLHGEGGAMSRYAQSCGQNQWSGGERIMPMSYDDAKSWTEEHADADVYEAEFGVPAEDAEHDLHVIISEAAWQALSRRAAADSIPVSKLIEQLAAEL